MKEIFDIIREYDNAVLHSKKCALATVVHVEGSSYRRPGARMLVTDDGGLTGAISGGCLEGDALRKSLLAISEGQNKLVTYDTTDEDDAKFGVQLGCNGIVHILFEPIHNGTPHNPIFFLKKWAEKRRAAVLTTLFSLKEKNWQIGTCFFCAANETLTAKDFQQITPNTLLQNIQQDAAQVLQNKVSTINTYEEDLWHSFFQFIPPPVRLIIAGAGNDAIPLVSIANLLGWQVTLVDGRQTHANAQRFPQVKNIIVAKAENVLHQITLDENAVCVLMTHNYNYDLALLKGLLSTPTSYIGILGPKTKMQRMYDDLKNQGISIKNTQHIYSPMGLNIGAETSEEIAVSIAAEIKAVLMKKNAQNLRDKALPIHS